MVMKHSRVFQGLYTSWYLCHVCHIRGRNNGHASQQIYQGLQTKAQNCLFLWITWFVLICDDLMGRWGLLILDLFLLVCLPWFSASVTDTLLFALVTSWLSLNPISRAVFSLWPLTSISLYIKTIKWYSLNLPVSHGKFFSLKCSFLVSQHLWIFKNRPYTAINPFPWKVQLRGIHTWCRRP